VTAALDLYPRFASLFSGLETAFGYNSKPPRWEKRPPRPEDWVAHLSGRNAGIGMAPLRPDNTVMFAAIDLDEPDFKAAREMQDYIPGASFVERSKSGNAHVWVFFSSPCPAWLAMGMLREACLAAGKNHVEVFPKNHDFSLVKFGNWINLPYHGDQRPILRAEPNDLCEAEESWHPDLQAAADRERWEYTLEDFIEAAEATKNDPAEWQKRANYLLITPPEERETNAEFGNAKTLHICAQHVIENAESNPVVTGHRAIVYFNLAKALTNWNQVDSDEALDFMRDVNSASPDSIPDSELRRILGNAERGQFTSTGCDDPLFAPYAHPDCAIAHPRR
jgi:hypothetical protein